MRFSSCCMICCLAIYANNSIAVNSVITEKGELVLAKAKEFAENSHKKSASIELMNFMKIHKKGATGVSNSDAIDISILYDLQDELSKLGYTIKRTPTDTGFNYNVSFSPLKYQQSDAKVGRIGQKTRGIRARKEVQQNSSNAFYDDSEELKISIDNLSDVVRNLTSSIDELNARLDKNNNLDYDEDGTDDQIY